jgi:hypothetical protein
MAHTPDMQKLYVTFKELKNNFIETMKYIEKDTTIILDWEDVNINNTGNWFIMFAPSHWGKIANGFSGIHYSLQYYNDKESNKEYVRLSVGVEKPLVEEYRDSFKKDVVMLIKKRGIELPMFDVWPAAGIILGKKLIETRSSFNALAWKGILGKYLLLEQFNGAVGEIIRKYNERGCFADNLEKL